MDKILPTLQEQVKATDPAKELMEQMSHSANHMMSAFVTPSTPSKPVPKKPATKKTTSAKTAKPRPRSSRA